MKTSVLYLVLFLVLITGVISLGGQNLNAEHNENNVQYELNLSIDEKMPEQNLLQKIDREYFVEEKLELEQWMSDPNEWN